MIKKILITGASSGLGRELSIYFSEKKINLVCIGKNRNKVLSLKKKINTKDNKFFAYDLNKERNLNLLLKKIGNIKNIDAIIHCMGGGLGIHEDLISKKNFLKLFNLNLFIQSEINNFFIKKKLSTKEKLKIIHISSVASIENTASVGYSVAKSALNIYSKILSKKLAHNKIQIKNLILGGFETKDNSFARLKKKNILAYKKFINSRMPLRRLSKTEEIIPIVEFILEARSEIISGDLIIDNFEADTFRN